MTKGCEDSNVQFCSACNRLSRSGRKVIALKIFFSIANLRNVCAAEFIFNVRAVPLLRPPEADIAGRGPNLQDGSASVQLALSAERSGSPLVAFACNVNVGKVGGNVVTAAQVDAGPHRDGNV